MWPRDQQQRQQRDAALALHAEAITTDIALIKALGGGYRFAGVDANAAPAVSQTQSR